ncbi:XVIPCD domain-containing protein [Pseudoxanthomonas sp. JBR18]|uniref:XVIPCD domain-containing protein n=1 Tax=Pseudoxanthomonas sp. JBR18 TaxID=2969308 RepID=UPI0023064651|nr:XVIPCD domain-containing protein [Pseudoxanthomonas sp. JBR18]WCE05670.1 hypothetical protein PJ250_06915 [Pseudoxanthomonas sp. JBR18]
MTAATPAQAHTSEVIGPDHPEHPEHRLYAQIARGVHQLDAEVGRAPDEASARMIARLMPLAREKGFRRVDHVVLSRHIGLVEQGENVFLVQGRLDDPAHKRAFISTDEATGTPVADSLRRLDAANARRRRRNKRGHAEEDDD